MLQLICNSILFIVIGIYTIHNGKQAQQSLRKPVLLWDKITFWLHRNDSEEELEIYKRILLSPKRVKREGRRSVNFGVFLIYITVFVWTWLLVVEIFSK